MKVSLIGLGIMGHPMAENLRKAGLLSTVYNRTIEKTRSFEENGIKVGKTPKEASEEADVIITMLSDSSDVEEVILGEEGVIHSVKQGAIVIDMSSINPEVSKNINEALNNVGVEFLDAPVSGGEKGAIEGTLSIMVGGKSNVLEKVEHILEKMGSSIVLVGPVGAGGYAKLANQIIVGLNIQAMSEAFALSKKAGLDFEKLYKAISKGLAGSQVLDKKIHNLIQEDFTPGFKLELHLKDLNNALNASNSKNLTLPFTQELKEKMVEIVKEGQGESDHSVLYKFQSR